MHLQIEQNGSRLEDDWERGGENENMRKEYNEQQK